MIPSGNTKNTEKQKLVFPRENVKNADLHKPD